MVIQFPAPQTYGGASPYGPFPVRFHSEVSEKQYKSEVYEYADGNADYLLWADVKTIIFYLEYEILTEADAATLDAHLASARGQHLGFSFYDWRASTMYTDVHYLSYQRPPHKKKWIQSRSIQLIKRGATV